MTPLTNEQIEKLERSIEELFPSNVIPAFWSYSSHEEEEEEDVS